MVGDVMQSYQYTNKIRKLKWKAGLAFCIHKNEIKKVNISKKIVNAKFRFRFRVV